MEKDISIKTNVSENENVISEIEGDTNTVKALEKEITSTNKTTQVLIKKEGDREDEYLSYIKDFHMNDSKILSLLNQESGSNYYSFTGLMRKLNLHQQSLARALNRLQDLGLVDRSNKGYTLTKNGILTLSKNSVMGAVDKTRRGKEYIQLLQTYIPIKIKAKEIIHSLIGKWFNNLRWAGLIENETEYMLQWISDDNSFQINLRIISGYIVIETNAISDKEKIEAMIGSYRIFEQIMRILQSKLIGIGIYTININHNPLLQNN
ncbi:MAG: LysR family transcriptional regulator [Nitrososphaeraceae archaeon]